MPLTDFSRTCIDTSYDVFFLMAISSVGESTGRGFKFKEDLRDDDFLTASLSASSFSAASAC